MIVVAVLAIYMKEVQALSIVSRRTLDSEVLVDEEDIPHRELQDGVISCHTVADPFNSPPPFLPSQQGNSRGQHTSAVSSYPASRPTDVQKHL